MATMTYVGMDDASSNSASYTPARVSSGNKCHPRCALREYKSALMTLTWERLRNASAPQRFDVGSCHDKAT